VHAACNRNVAVDVAREAAVDSMIHASYPLMAPAPFRATKASNDRLLECRIATPEFEYSFGVRNFLSKAKSRSRIASDPKHFKNFLLRYRNSYLTFAGIWSNFLTKKGHNGPASGQRPPDQRSHRWSPDDYDISQLGRPSSGRCFYVPARTRQYKLCYFRNNRCNQS